MGIQWLLLPSQSLTSSLKEISSGMKMGTSGLEGGSDSHPLLMALGPSTHFLLWEQSCIEIN